MPHTRVVALSTHVLLLLGSALNLLTLPLKVLQLPLQLGALRFLLLLAVAHLVYLAADIG